MGMQTPDFRKMTPEELREGMTVLNKVIRGLRDFQKTQKKRLVVSAGTGAVATAVATALFPPAGILAAAGSMMLSAEPATGTTVGGMVLKDAIELRRKFKEVWRARPGRSFHDIAARIEREKRRKKQAGKLRK